VNPPFTTPCGVGEWLYRISEQTIIMKKLTQLASCLLMSICVDAMAQNMFLERGRQAYNRLSPEEQMEAVRSVMAGEGMRVQQTQARKPVLPDSMENAKALGDANDSIASYRMYARLAKAGDLEAMTEQATMQINGIGVPADPEAGNRLMREASDRGSAMAAQRIAVGQMAKGRTEDGWLWFQLAAERNDPLSQVMVGHWLEAGPDIKHDYKAAVRWYKRALANRYALGFYQLALMFEAGKGVKKNKMLALALYPEGPDYDEQRIKLQSTLKPAERAVAEGMRDEIRNAAAPLAVIEAFESGQPKQR
jgi:TPR repeat protein